MFFFSPSRITWQIFKCHTVTVFNVPDPTKFPKEMFLMQVVFWLSCTHLCEGCSLIRQSDSNLYRDTLINRACHAAVMSILDHRKIYQLLFRCSSGGYEVNKMYLFITHVYLLPWDLLHNLHEPVLCKNAWHLAFI